MASEEFSEVDPLVGFSMKGILKYEFTPHYNLWYLQYNTFNIESRAEIIKFIINIYMIITLRDYCNLII